MLSILQNTEIVFSMRFLLFLSMIYSKRLMQFAPVSVLQMGDNGIATTP